MSKKFLFLISFVLVLSLVGLAQAGTPIVVDNNSFEYDCNGNDVTCHVGHWITPGSMCDGYIAGWRYLPQDGGWVGVDVNCGWEDEGCDNCHDWIEYPDGSANLYFQGIASAHQILDHDIAYGRKYTMTVDLFAWDTIVVQFFSPNDVCYPDANHFLLSSAEITPERWYNAEAGREMYERDVKVECVITDAAMTGRKLGIKIGGDYLIGGASESYLWADHVRLEWSWASNAYDPAPADGTVDVNNQALTLSWLPGLWAVNDVNGHEVYFGTSWAEVNDATTATTGVYRGTGVGVVSGPDGNDRYSYVIPGGDLPLDLGKTYFWRIDEVNDSYVGPAPKPWKGEVWSFTVTGYAYNVYPPDGGTDIPALDLTIHWEAGVGAGGHDVYFGSNQADVEDANTANTALYPGVYRGPTQALADTNYLVPEDLEVGSAYFWKIDEVNTGSGTFVPGEVWTFTTGAFLIVDSFEAYRYVDTAALRVAWKDYWSGSLGGKNGAEVRIMSDNEDVIYGGEQSMEYYFRNFNKIGPDYVGSEAEAALPLEVGTNWTKGGVKALELNFYGHLTNLEDTIGVYNGIHQDQMYVALEDGDGGVGLVKYPDMNAIAEQSWHTWNIKLEDPCLSDVNMADVAKVYIGFGGQKVGQTKDGAGYKTSVGDTVWFDDIRLYPPRCLPETTGIAVLRGLGDITGPEGTQDCNTDYLDLDLMSADWLIADGCFPTEPQDAVLTMLAGDPNWTGGHVGTGSLGFDPNIQVDVSNPGLMGLTHMSITAWVKRDGMMDGYEGLLTSREDLTTEITNGVDGAMVGYCWNDMQKTWMWDSLIAIPDKTWTFVAMAVDPTGCTIYGQPAGGTLESNRQTIELDPLGAFENEFWIGRGYAEARYWKGGMDDVRIWDYALAEDEMLYLATLGFDGNEPDPNCPVYHYKFDDGSGLVAADSGCGALIYRPPMSPANLVDPEEVGSRFVNFRDYRIMAEHWLEQHPWP